MTMFGAASGETACQIASDTKLSWGLSIFGGKWLVGSRDELLAVGVTELRPGLDRAAVVTLAYLQGLKPSYRSDALARFGLEYSVNAPAIATLKAAGIVTINKAGAIGLTPFGRNLRPFKPSKEDGTDSDGYYMPSVNLIGWPKRGENGGFYPALSEV